MELTFTNDVHFKINRSIDTLLHIFIRSFVFLNHIFIIYGEVKKIQPQSQKYTDFDLPQIRNLKQTARSATTEMQNSDGIAIYPDLHYLFLMKMEKSRDIMYSMHPYL